MTDGIYRDLSIEDYHNNDTHISATSLKYAAKSLKHLWHYRQGSFNTEKKEHFELGNVFELALLEPDKVEDLVAIFDPEERAEPDKTFASNKNKEWKVNFYKENASKYIVSKDSFEQLKHMLDACVRDAAINKLLKNINYQTSVFWTDESGLKCKTRPDVIKAKKRILVDVKTTDDASPIGFSRSLTKFDYPLQAVMQCDGCIKGGLLDRVDAYYWLVVEKKAPYNAQLYEFLPEDRADNMFHYKRLLERVYKSLKESKFPGYGDMGFDDKYGVLSAYIPTYYSISKLV